LSPTTREPARPNDAEGAELGAPKNPLTSATPIKLQIFTRGGVPGGVNAVALNLTLTNTSGGVSAYPDGTTRPTASNLNWTKGQTIPNLVQASTGTTGIIDFWNLGSSSGKIDLIIDAFGYYQAAEHHAPPCASPRPEPSGRGEALRCLADVDGPGAESEQPLQLGVLVAVVGVDVDVQSELPGPRVAAGLRRRAGCRSRRRRVNGE
jgi:hypothetical protein